MTGERSEPLARRVAAFVNAASPGAYRAALLSVLAVIVSTVIAVEGAGAVRVNRFAHDTFLLLDGGWRVMQGQRPHVDFYSPLGALPSLLVAFGLAVGGHHVSALVHGSVLLALVLGPWTFALARPRLSAPCSAAAALVVVYTLLGTHPLGFALDDSSYAMLYNRYGFAILAVIWLELFTSTRETPPATRRRTIAIGGASSGALIALLLFLKLNFFGLAVGAAGWRLLSRPGRKPWVVGTLVGLVGTSLPFFAYLHFDVVAMLRDLRTVTLAREQTLSMYRVLDVVLDNGWWLAAVAVCAAAAALVSPARGRRVSVADTVADPFLLACLGVLAIATNFQEREAPIFAMGALPLVQRAAHVVAPVPETELRRLRGPFLVATALAGLLIVCTVGPDAVGVLVTTAGALAPVPADERVANGALTDFVTSDKAGACPDAYAAKLRDGLGILDGVTSDRTRLFVADFTDPFNFALRLSSPRGDALWWHYGTTYNEGSPLSPESVFRDVNLALVPRICPEDGATDRRLRRSHIAWLMSHFAVRATSRYWVLLERR